MNTVKSQETFWWKIQVIDVLTLWQEVLTLLFLSCWPSFLMKLRCEEWMKSTAAILLQIKYRLGDMGATSVKTEPDLGGNYQCLLNLWNVLSRTGVNDAAWLPLLSQGRGRDFSLLGLHSFVFTEDGGFKGECLS